MRKFYGWATTLMTIALLGNLWNLVVTWVNMTNGSRMASISGGVAFNLLLAILFFGMWKTTPNTTDFSKTMTGEELNDLLKKYDGEKIAQNKPSMQDEDIVTRELSQKKEVKLHK